MSSRYAWCVVAVLSLAYVINYVDRQVVFSIFPVLRSDLRFSDTQLGFIGTVFTWIYSLCMPLTGRIADLVRRDRLVLASLVLWSLATCATGWSRSVTEFLVWRAMMGITESLYVPAALGLIAGLHPGPTRSRALSFHATAQFAGIALGGWYGGWMADHIGWRQGFFLLAAAGITYAAVLHRALRGLSPAAPGRRRAEPAAPGAILKSHSYLALSVAFFAFCVMRLNLYAWLPDFIYERYRLSLTESGFTATVYLQSSSAAGVLLGGVLGDRFGRRVRGGRFYVGSSGLLLCAPFAWLMLAVHSLLLLKLCAVAFGLFGGLFIANLFAAAYDVISERNYGLGTGALNMAGGLAGGAAILATGFWKASIGMATLMQWGAAAAAATACLLAGVVAASNHASASRN